MNIKTFVILDCETTGLPAFENNKTKITEICLISVQTEHVLLGVYPRVQNKLTLCFNPWKIIQPDAERITGLSNELLENEGAFNDTSLDLLINFLERLSKPICFVAHNGNCFDFPILKKHIEGLNKELPDYVYCVDSLVAFRSINTDVQIKNSAKETKEDEEANFSDDWDEALLNETLIVETLCSTEGKDKSLDEIRQANEVTPKKTDLTKAPHKPKKIDKKNTELLKQYSAKKRLNFDKQDKRKNKKSFKLSDVYQQFLQKEPVNAHHAEGDVIMLLECLVHLGETFVSWANGNAKPFNTINKSATYNFVRS